MSTTAERLRALIAQRREGDWRDASLVGEVLDRCAEEIAAVLEAVTDGRCSMCCALLFPHPDDPDVVEPHDDDCAIGALDRAIAAALGEEK